VAIERSAAGREGRPTPAPEPRSGPVAPAAQRARRAVSALQLFALLLALILLSRALVLVPAGSRGVLLRWGAIQEQPLDEGLHPLLPLLYSVQPMSVRLHSQILRSEAACRDLQDVGFDLAVNWHLRSDQVVPVFRRIGDDAAIVAKVITPTLEDGLKQVVAGFSAEQLISERAAVKQALETLIRERLANQQLELDGIDLLQLDFSERFRQAVEAKQVAEQDARRAAFVVAKAKRLAEARIQEAEGEARAQQLLQTGLTPQVLQHQAIEKWNGNLPLVMDSQAMRRLDLSDLLPLQMQDRPA
jgi:regulator of protease activity HflC (stomatin/prohibitin superfamily)